MTISSSGLESNSEHGEYVLLCLANCIPRFPRGRDGLVGMVP